MLSSIISQNQRRRNRSNLATRRRISPFHLINTRNRNERREPNITTPVPQPITEPNSPPPSPSFIMSETNNLPFFTTTLDENNDLNSFLNYDFDTILQYIYGPYEEEEESLNDERTIKCIKQNSKTAYYSDIKQKIINDTCPILMSRFEKKTKICYFKCFHAIDESTMESFAVHFLKCPLCNTNIN